jgi:hypothetical protein
MTAIFVSKNQYSNLLPMVPHPHIDRFSWIFWWNNHFKSKEIGLFWSVIDRSFWSFSRTLVINGVSLRSRWWEVIRVPLHEDFSAWVPLEEGPVWESLCFFVFEDSRETPTTDAIVPATSARLLPQLQGWLDSYLPSATSCVCE